jgi:hypothetical protein
MVEQARQCIATIRRHCRHDIDLCALGVKLSDTELAELRDLGVKVQTDVSSLPFYADSSAPPYAYAQTCRPFLPQVFEGYDIYLWVDVDIRFDHPDAFDFYLGQAAAEPRTIVIAHEIDPAYCFVQNPPQARAYHMEKNARILRTYGQQVAEHMQYFQLFNTGLFAMHREASLWQSWRNTLAHALKAPFHHMAEQDAMAVAIALDTPPIRPAPSIMNWLCSIAFPAFDDQSRRWVRPIYPHLPISVLHLTNSNTKLTIDGREMTFYDLYKLRKITT